VLGLLDDEHAASSIAAPIAVTPKATREVRGLCRLACWFAPTGKHRANK
jgi:hypothetical protein